MYSSVHENRATVENRHSCEQTACVIIYMQVGDNLLCVSDNLKHCQCEFVEDDDEEALSSALRIIGSDRIGSSGGSNSKF